jgi:hypothetical protein
MPVRTGVGFMSVTALEPEAEVSAELVAVTVRVLGEGSAAGAEYLPEASIVPRVAEPPGVLLTDQVTEVLAAWATVAAKVAESPARTLAVEGETLTVTVGMGGGWTGGVLVEDVEAQEARKRETGARRARDIEAWRNGRMVRICSGVER